MGCTGSKDTVTGPDSAGYKMVIHHCGGWGYGGKAAALQEQVVKEFGSKIQIVLQGDPGVTGNFEVTMHNNKTGTNKLIHSKKNGDGLVDDSNRDAFMTKVREFIKA